jgi:hypothetical protein
MSDFDHLVFPPYDLPPAAPAVNLDQSIGEVAMRIVQITSARISSHTEEPTILGLAEDGSVYAYRDELKPTMAKEQVMVSAEELTDEQKQYAQPVNSTPPPGDTPYENKGGIFRAKPAVKVIDAKVTHYIIWKEVYKDGWNAGWYPLPMTISQPIPHPQDPSRYERM